MTTTPTPVDPPQLHQNPAFTWGMIAPAGPTLYVGGQNGTDEAGAVLDGLGPQTEQALRNVLAVLEEAGTDADQVFESHGVKLYVDPISVRYLGGAQVDFLDTVTGGGFTIKNPNAVSTCGCGQSFSTS